MAAYIICWLLFSADVVGSGLVPGPYQNDSSRFAICMCFQKFHECSGSWNPFVFVEYHKTYLLCWSSHEPSKTKQYRAQAMFLPFPTMMLCSHMWSINSFVVCHTNWRNHIETRASAVSLTLQDQNTEARTPRAFLSSYWFRLMGEGGGPIAAFESAVRSSPPWA